jgi:hypothetical protein
LGFIYQSQFLFVMFKLWTNKNHSYKHNEQINNQNIDNSECFGVKFVKIYPEMTTIIFFKNMVLVDYIGIFFTCGNTFGHILYIGMINHWHSWSWLMIMQTILKPIKLKVHWLLYNTSHKHSLHLYVDIHVA